MSVLKTAIVASSLVIIAALFATNASAQQRKTWGIDPHTSQSKLFRKRGTLQAQAEQQPKTEETSEQADASELVVPTPPPENPSRLHLELLPPLPLQDPAVQPAQFSEPLPTPLHSEPMPLEGMEYDGMQYEGIEYEGMAYGGVEYEYGGEYGPGMPSAEFHGHPGQACDARCRVEQYWGRVDYLYWWFDGAHAPPLVTSSDAGTDRADAGILGLATTSLLLGNETIGDSGSSGGRVEFGRWFPSRGNLGWHVAYMGVGDVEEHATYDSDSIAILARPFYSVEPGVTGPNAELVALPGELEGSASVLHSTSLDGFEFMFRQMLASGPKRRLQVVAGYQTNSLDDDLSIRDFKRVIGGGSGLAIGTTLTENDSFESENQFHGAALGVLASTRNCRWTMDLGMQLAFGTNRGKVSIDGSTTSSVPVAGAANSVETTPGGLLALGTNLGSYEKDSFAVIPQVHLGLGYDWNSRLRLLFGYRFLYWSQVARAAEQIDPSLNLSQLDAAGLSGEPRPRFDMRLTDFWAQGVNAGLEYRF
ncbi:BBP7 family outer membrane beta-barrel protein [Roseimaritima ulvae]|uniref:Outer membrane protein beta-barrel domain-containing protein n=1 Tax=Roseimaritima ulvae TaxID=980254 RepID=A0A5B9R745_9BACT|nr:BBP7 family outer membrane beta-barrel protein [Roseimaritima ulvae]QEG42243.1 hypothetical protein UC8_42770 [Roseimaritima ulvae]